MSSSTERRDPIPAAAASSAAEVDLGDLAGNATRRAEIAGGGVGTEPGPGEAARYPSDPPVAPLDTRAGSAVAMASTPRMTATPASGRRVPWRRIVGALVAAAGLWVLWKDGLIR